MKAINTISSDAYQTVSFILDDGSVAVFTFRYLPAVQRWMVDVEHVDGTIRGLDMSLSPNILRPWRNSLRFGLAVTAADGVDPILQNDFSAGRVSVYVLSKEEVRTVERDIYESAI